MLILVIPAPTAMRKTSSGRPTFRAALAEPAPGAQSSDQLEIQCRGAVVVQRLPVALERRPGLTLRDAVSVLASACSWSFS